MDLIEIYCKAVTDFWGEEITDPKQLTQVTFTTDDANELKEFCELYYQIRITNEPEVEVKNEEPSSIIAVVIIVSAVAAGVASLVFSILMHFSK